MRKEYQRAKPKIKEAKKVYPAKKTKRIRLSKSQDHIISVKKFSRSKNRKRKKLNKSLKQLKSPKHYRKNKINKYNVYQMNMAKKNIDPKFLIRWRTKIEGVVD